MKKLDQISPVAAIFIHLIFIFFSLLCIIPIVAVISISLTGDIEISKYGYRLIPVTLNTDAYRILLGNPGQLINGYLVTVIVTGVGSFFALLICSMLAYPISRGDYRYKKKVTLFIYITMLFNGGLVPFYILIVNYLKMQDTLWALIVPYLVAPWYVFLLRTFFQKLPVELVESAKLDGAREFRIFFTIILPLSKPALATVGLFLALRYWNDWWLSLLFIDRNLDIMPLQYLLYRTMTNIEFVSQHADMFTRLSDIEFPAESARMAMCILAAGPMLFVFPFFQKYFVKGLTVGSLKG